MSILTFIGYWFLIALCFCVAHYVMRKRIDGEIRNEDQGI